MIGKLKQTLAMALALCMVFSLCPVSAMAEELQPEDVHECVFAAGESVAASCTAGGSGGLDCSFSGAGCEEDGSSGAGSLTAGGLLATGSSLISDFALW